jgi:hypothetical protein
LKRLRRLILLLVIPGIVGLGQFHFGAAAATILPGQGPAPALEQPQGAAGPEDSAADHLRHVASTACVFCACPTDGVAEPQPTANGWHAACDPARAGRSARPDEPPPRLSL